MPHVYDGSLNDGFCADCDKPAHDLVHRVEPWREAWERSRRLQQKLREEGKPHHYLSAQREYDYCQAVQESPSGQGPTAEEWFREDVPVSRTDAVDAAEPASDLHAVRVADAPTAERAGAASMTTIRKGITYLTHVADLGTMPQPRSAHR